MLRLFGHERVSIPDGGLAAWRRAGGLLSGTMAQPAEGTFTARPAIGVDVVTMAQLVDGTERRDSGWESLRCAAGQTRRRGAGTTQGPSRPVISPGSRNLPFSKLFDEDGKYRDAATIRSAVRRRRHRRRPQPGDHHLRIGCHGTCALAVGLAPHRERADDRL